jgi:HEAT repeat protein
VEMGLGAIIYVIFLILILDLILIFLIFFNKRKHKKEKEKIEKMDQFIVEEMIGKTKFLLKKDLKLFLARFSALKQNFYLDKETAERFTDIVEENNLERYFTKRLQSIIKYKKIEAVVYLGIIATDDSRNTLEKALKKEKDYSAKLYIINSLVDIGAENSISKIIATIPNAPRWYREKVQPLLYEYGRAFYEHISEIKESNNRDIKELIIGFAEIYAAEDLKEYLIEVLENPEEETSIKYKAVDALSKIYYTELNNERYINHPDIYIRSVAITSLGNYQSEENILKLISMLGEEAIKKFVVVSISIIIAEKPRYIKILISEFNKENNSIVKNALAEVFSNRMEYLILKLSGNQKDVFKDVIKEIMLMGKNSDIIGFLNRNKDIEIENEIILILKKVIEERPEIKNEFCTYLNERILKKCNLTKYISDSKKNEEQKDKKVLAFLYFLIFTVFFLFPIVYIVRHKDLLLIMDFIESACFLRR